MAATPWAGSIEVALRRGAGQVGAGLADYFTLGVVGDAAISEARSRDAACMLEKGYARGGTP